MTSLKPMVEAGQVTQAIFYEKQLTITILHEIWNKVKRFLFLLARGYAIFDSLPRA